MKKANKSKLYSHPHISRPVYLACDKSAYREDLQKVYFHNGKAYASDAHIAVRIPVEDVFSYTDKYPPNGTFLTRDQFEMAMGLHIDITEEGIILKDYNALMKFGVTETRTNAIGESMNWAERIDKIFEEPTVPNPTSEIGFNIVLLNNLNKILKDNIMRVYFNGNNRAIRYKNIAGDTIAILMPTMIDPSITM